MRWRLRLLGPLSIGGTIKRRGYRGKLPDGWKCPHNHQRKDTAIACANAEQRRRDKLGYPVYTTGTWPWSGWARPYSNAVAYVKDEIRLNGYVKAEKRRNAIIAAERERDHNA